MKYVCKKRCFYKSVEYVPGETLEADKSEKLPKHFVKQEDYKPEKKVHPKEPETLKELGEQLGEVPPKKKKSK